jgi:hypothetical protein
MQQTPNVTIWAAAARQQDDRKVDSSILSLTTTPGGLISPLTCAYGRKRGIPMARYALLLKFSDLRKRLSADVCATAEPQEERKTMTVPQPRPRRRKPLDAGLFAREIGSFRLHLAAEGKAAKTVRTCTEAVQWFAAAHLIPRTSHARWDQVSGHDVQRWLVHLRTLYSDACASNQFRALQQFFRWPAGEEQIPDPMTRLRAPKVSEKLVPVFTSEELSALEKTCQGR